MSKSRAHNDGTNLIVNYLPQTVDEDELSTLFSECGMIEAVKVIRDGKSQISRGFAFVKFVDRESADKAMKKYTGFKMGRKTLRVSLSRPAGEETRETNLLIENIPESWDDDRLHQQFQVYGQIITHRVVKNMEGQSKCRAYVRYNLKAEAEDAITALSGINIGGEDELVVRFADPPVVRATPELISKKNTRTSAQPYPSPARAPRDLPYSTLPHMREPGRDPYLEHHRMEVSPSRAIVRPAFNRPPRSKLLPHMPNEPVVREKGHPATWGASRAHPYHPEAGSTWGEFVSPVLQPDMANISSGGVLSDSHKSSYDPEKGWCVFVYNLPPTASNETLYQLFSKFGAINSVKPVVDKNEKCKGYGFVHMVNYEDACRSIQSLEGTPMQGKPLQVRFKNAKK